MTIQYSIERTHTSRWTKFTAAWIAFGKWRKLQRQKHMDRVALAQLSNRMRRDIGLEPIHDPLVKLLLLPKDTRRR